LPKENMLLHQIDNPTKSTEQMEVKICIPPEASLLVQAAHTCKVYETRTPV
jgi:hypothetical protein